MGVSNTSSLGLSTCHSVPWSSHDGEEVHSENTDTGVVLDTQVNVLLDTESKVSSLGEVAKDVWISLCCREGGMRESPSKLRRAFRVKERKGRNGQCGNAQPLLWWCLTLNKKRCTHRLLNSYSLTFNALSKTSSALGPLIVTWHAIFSFRRILKDRMVKRALEETGV